jgi:hypothetical protein
MEAWMKESTTYQAIKAKGRLEEVLRLLLRVGEDRFGTAPTPEQQALVEGITDAGRLEDLVIRTGHVNSWAELLEQRLPSPTPRADPAARNPHDRADGVPGPQSGSSGPTPGGSMARR